MSAPGKFASDQEVDGFVERFRARTLPKPEWTHQAHLVVGLWHLQRYSFDEAFDQLRSGIRSYNEAIGVTNSDEAGYHDTLTGFFLRGIAVFTGGGDWSGVELFNRLVASRLRDKLLPLAFYSRGRMLSVEARRQWLEPDLQSLEHLSDLIMPGPNEPAFYLRPAGRPDAEAFLKLVTALAEFEKLEPPDEAARARLIEDAFGEKPRIEVWLAIADESLEPVANAIFLETYSSFMALPKLYIEDIFVKEEFRGRGIGSALMRKAVELAHDRGCGRVEWTALDWNTRAQRVYEEKLGAKRMSEWYFYRMTRAEMKACLDGGP